MPERRERLGLALLGLGACAAIGVGVAAALIPPLLVVAGLVALAIAAAFARSVPSMLVAVVAAAMLLPFGTLPFKIGITPPLLELASLALFAMLLIRGLVAAQQPLRWSPLAPAVILLTGLSFFSFLIGSGGSPSPLTAHNYFKFLLGVGMFFAIQQVVHTPEEARWALRMLIIVGTLAALIGIGLWAAPDPLALRLLVSLAPIGYPASGRVLRYVEDDPNGIERAIGTSVDPNGFGGLMALIGAVTIAQALATHPVWGRKKLWAAGGLMALAVYLTQSRAALGGLVLALGFLATVRYRRLWRLAPLAVLAAMVVIVGLDKGDAFVERIVEGLQFKDQANQMRLAEFRNAIAIIREYPVFGVGFGSAPSIDLTTGVSSIYLTIASRMGLVGLTMYAITCLSFFVITTKALKRVDAASGEAITALQAALIGALAVGVLDHYFFNIEFPHMVALFWLLAGLAMVFCRFESSSTPAQG